MTPEELLCLWEKHSKNTSNRLNGMVHRGKIPPGLLQRMSLALRRWPDKDWDAVFARVLKAPMLNGTPFFRKYASIKDVRKTGSEGFMDSFRADLLWILEPKNLQDIESGVYDKALE